MAIGRSAASARWARATVLTVVAVATVIAAAASAAPRAHTPDEAMDAARVRRALGTRVLRTVDGRALDPAALHGGVVVLNFWASWCAPCRKELPRLDALHASIAPLGGRVVAISIDHEAGNVRRFIRTHRLSLPVVHDGPDGIARRLDLPHVPFTIVLDRDGSVALTTGGADQQTLEAIAATTRRLLASMPAGSPAVAEGTR